MINLHVLLVDEEAGVRRAIAASLALDPFFVVRECASGAEAIRQAIGWRPDLVLLDADMPGMRGAAVLARLRADKRTAPIPVVLLTAGERTCARFNALGAAGVIAKPFEPAGIAAAVRRFIALEGVLLPAREHFLQRLRADAGALAVCRLRLTQAHWQAALTRINEIAHSLAGAGGIYGFAGITCESAALSDAAQNRLAGRAKPIAVQRALDRLLRRIAPQS